MTTTTYIGWEDVAGFDLRVGEYVVYTVMLGRSPYLSFGRVIAATPAKEEGYRRQPAKLRVVGTEPLWLGLGGVHVGHAKAKKPSYIQYHERVLAIAATAVPEKLKPVLDEAWEQAMKAES